MDTHFDTAVDVGGEMLSHCCPITRAVDAGFDPKNIVIIGTSGWMNPRSELAYCLEKGITLLPLEKVWEMGPDAVAEKAVSVASNGTNGVYLTLDIDVLNSSYAPGTGVPTTCGMTPREMLAAIIGPAVTVACHHHQAVAEHPDSSRRPCRRRPAGGHGDAG